MNSLIDMTAGKSLGRYELLLPIAQGGMAVIWAARIRGTQKLVAVKSMLPILSDDPQFEDMFLEEARLASRIKHPNVCEIIDLGEDLGTLYLVMEWIDGEPLNLVQKVARDSGGVPLALAAAIGLRAARGLHAAHELRNPNGEFVGLVHRDVSPQNVLISYSGEVKIVDFGVAKATNIAERNITRAGQVKGKVPFMSPEQAAGGAIDRRTDVFALGVVLYQLIAKKHPLRQESNRATLERIADKIPVLPLQAVVRDCPSRLSATIQKALEKDVSRRFRTMADFADALEESLEDFGRIDEDNLRGFMQALLFERGDARRESIQDAIALADYRRRERTSTRLLEPGARMSEVPSAFPVEPRLSEPNLFGDRPSGLPLGGSAFAVSESPPSFRPTSRRRLWGFGLVACLSLVLGLVLVSRTTGGSFSPAALAHAPALQQASATQDETRIGTRNTGATQVSLKPTDGNENSAPLASASASIGTDSQTTPVLTTGCVREAPSGASAEPLKSRPFSGTSKPTGSSQAIQGENRPGATFTRSLE